MTPTIDPKMIADPNFEPVTLKNACEGWRAWTVDRTLPPYGLPPKLYSATYNYYWNPKQKAEAECRSCGQPDGIGVPGEDCSCGFYSAKNLIHLMKMGYHMYYEGESTFTIVGQIACWGKVIEATSGWRSQYAYPVVLFVPHEAGGIFAKRLKDTYGCQVRLLNFLKQPDEIDQQWVDALIAGTAKPVIPAKKAQRKGRRVEHKALRFTGRCTGEPYDVDGKQYVDVEWDVNIGKTVRAEVSNLKFENR
jgi:hypothetical protein